MSDTSTPVAPAENPSLIRKANARLAAVQCLYQSAGSGRDFNAERLAGHMKELLSTDKEARKAVCASGYEPHYPTLTKLLKGIGEHWAEIEALIESTQPRQTRTSPLLKAILQCGIYELRFSQALKPHHVIAEYTALTGRFFDDAEVGFVHALLRKLAAPLESSGQA